MKENQRVVLTKRMLREGLVRCLQTKPLEKIGVSELCQESGINRATFYRHYETPRDVLRELSRDLMHGLEIPMKSMEPAELETLLEKICTYLYERADLLRILIHNHTDEEIARSLNILCDRLWEKQTDGLMPDQFDKSELDLLSAFIGGGSYFLLSRWLTEEHPRPPQEMAALCIRFIRKVQKDSL